MRSLPNITHYQNAVGYRSKNRKVVMVKTKHGVAIEFYRVLTAKEVKKHKGDFVNSDSIKYQQRCGIVVRITHLLFAPDMVEILGLIVPRYVGHVLKQSNIID
jgi:hypothetical protein